MEVTPATTRRYSTGSIATTASTISSGIVALAGYTSPVEMVEDVVGGFQQLTAQARAFYRRGGYVFPTAVAVGRRAERLERVEEMRVSLRRMRESHTGRVSKGSYPKGYSRMYWLKYPSRKK